MECKRLPKVYEIENFSLKIILLFKNAGLIVSLKHQKNEAFFCYHINRGGKKSNLIALF